MRAGKAHTYCWNLVTTMLNRIWGQGWVQGVLCPWLSVLAFLLKQKQINKIRACLDYVKTWVDSHLPAKSPASWGPPPFIEETDDADDWSGLERGWRPPLLGFGGPPTPPPPPLLGFPSSCGALRSLVTVFFKVVPCRIDDNSWLRSGAPDLELLEGPPKDGGGGGPGGGGGGGILYNFYISHQFFSISA